MRTKIVPSNWLQHGGCRLDCGPYMSGAREASAYIERLPHETLIELTAGHQGGIFNGPQFKRNYVHSSEYGVRFLTGGDVLQADLSRLPFLSRKDAYTAKLKHLRLSPGMTIISCSGAIGRTAYVRPDMDGIWSSQDVMKVVPDRAKIPPGYLYAYLSSKFGVRLIVGGTYGAIIPHIEPEHIADLRVPRFSHQLEEAAHKLVDQAARLRAAAASELDKVGACLLEALGLTDIAATVSDFSVNTVPANSLNLRLDAPYHSDVAARALHAVAHGKYRPLPLSAVVKRYFKPPIFKRMWVDDETHGRQFISGVDAYRYQAESTRFVSRRTPKFEEFILEEGTVIFQAAGQIYGLFAQPLFVSGWLSGLFAADDLYRLVPQTLCDGGYLYAFLRTGIGQILLKRQASGDSIPRVWDPHIRDVEIPWPDDPVREDLGARVVAAHSMIERARVAETEAITLVDRAIETGER